MRPRFLISLLAALACLGMAAKPAVATTVPGDPMATQCYTLSNGLKVFLSVNHQSPRISAHIAVRTGSPIVVAMMRRQRGKRQPQNGRKRNDCRGELHLRGS